MQADEALEPDVVRELRDASVDGRVEHDLAEVQDQVDPATVTPRLAVAEVAPALAFDAGREPVGQLSLGLGEVVSVMTLGPQVDLAPAPELVELWVERERQDWLVGLEGPAAVELDREVLVQPVLPAEVGDRRDLAARGELRDEAQLDAVARCQLQPLVDEHQRA